MLKVVTLLPGDIIYIGKLHGVVEIKIDDLIEIEIEGIGKLINKVSKI
ncbi:fumarylacetoacetate hydrolase family protein [Bacillus sp. JJ1533]